MKNTTAQKELDTVQQNAGLGLLDLPKTRSEAKELGIKHYFTGNACKNGHVSKRLTSSGQCLDCCKRYSLLWISKNREIHNQRSRRYFNENKEKINERARQHRAENREAILLKEKKWRDENREKERARWDKYKRENPEKVLESDLKYKKHNKELIRKWQRDYKKSNKEKILFLNSNYRARKKNAIPKWFEKEKVELVYKKAKEIGLTVDHVVPITSSLVCGLHCWDNLQLLDKSLNSSKSNKTWPNKNF